MWVSEYRFIELLGKNRAKMFLESFGGQRVYIPVRVTRQHKIAQCIGLSGLALLSRQFATRTICLPSASRQQPLKKEILRQCREQGMSINKASKVAGCTERYATVIFGRLKATSSALGQSEDTGTTSADKTKHVISEQGKSVEVA